jgi:hypothetical protein
MILRKSSLSFYNLHYQSSELLRSNSSSLSFAAIEDLELVALVGGEEGGNVAEALG